MAGGIYSYLPSHFFTPAGMGERGGEKKKITKLGSQEVMTHSFLMEGTKAGDKGGGDQLWGYARLCQCFYFCNEKRKMCGWKKRKSHQTSEGRFLSKLCPHRVLCELELD